MAYVYNSQLDAFSLYHKIQESPEPPTSLLGGPALPALGHALAGSTGAAISNISVFPLDLIITRLQVQRQLRKNSSIPDADEYKSISDAAYKIYTQEGGLSAFYNGVVQGTGKSIADSFLFFLAYNFIRQKRLQSRGGESSKSLPIFDELSVGAISGAFAKLLTTPIANIVTRKQTASMVAARSPASSQPPSPSARDIALQIRDEKGLQGFWSGYSASLILTLNPSLTFFFYETFKQNLLPHSQRDKPSASATFFLAAISKAIASTITYPFSLAKARAQASSAAIDDNDAEVKEGLEQVSGGELSGSKPTRRAARSTVFSTILHIARTEGMGALYEGLSGEVLKGFFSHGITMIVKEAVHKLIIQLYYYVLKALQKYPSPQELAQQAGGHAQTAVTNAEERAQIAISSVKEGAQNLVGKGQDAMQNGQIKAQDVYANGKDQAGGLYNKGQKHAQKAYEGIQSSSYLNQTTESVSPARAITNPTSRSADTLYEKETSPIPSSTSIASTDAKALYGKTQEQAATAYQKNKEGVRDVGQKTSETGELVLDYIGRQTEEMGKAMRRKTEEEK
ncbi:MAG: hypothetical protein M1827_002602 [Pycnora praestabilis]|nr:MAG: hypothetical protein M1827_002602 [Pycnora praestabilis]